MSFNSAFNANYEPNKKKLKNSFGKLSELNTFYKTKTIKPSNSHSDLSQSGFTSVFPKSKFNEEKIKPNAPSFLVNKQISILERLRLRSISKKLFKNLEDKNENQKETKKLNTIKFNVNKLIDKSSQSKTYSVDFLLNFKQKYNLPVLSNLMNHASGAKSKNISCGTSTIYLKKNEKKNIYLEQLLLMQPDSSYLLKKAIKWKNLKWLLEHKKGIFKIKNR